MSVLAEDLSNRLVLKIMAGTTYDPTTAPDITVDPGASGGQIWRYVSHNLGLTHQTFQADEKRTDQVAPMMKLGTRQVPAQTNHLLSCGTHYMPLAAVLQGDWTTAVVAGDETDYTSAAADNSTAKFTFAGGNPVTDGFRVGDIIRFTGLSEAANNGVNFLILAFGGSNNREVTVWPAPTTMTADNEFDVTTVGRSIFAPATGLVRRKFALETYTPDSDIARVFSDIRFGGFEFSVGANAMATLNFSGIGRARNVFSGGSAPFFTAPDAETTSDVISSMDGLLRLNGATLAVASALSISWNKALAAPATVNPNKLAGGVVATANAVVGGQFTVFEVDTAFDTLYENGTEFELMAYLPESPAANVNAMTMFLPRCKITNQTPTVVDGARAIQCDWTAARYVGSAPGVESTVMRIVDTTLTLAP